MTAERLRELLHYNPKTGVFRWLVTSGKARVGAVAGHIRPDGYRVITMPRFRPSPYRAPRLAWLYMTDRWPHHHVDHINLKPDDNRWINLREATSSQNSANRKIQSNNTSGAKGVRRTKSGRWAARAKKNGKEIYLGTYNRKHDAAVAVIDASKKLHGEFARIR